MDAKMSTVPADSQGCCEPKKLGTKTIMANQPATPNVPPSEIADFSTLLTIMFP